ncbi:hypothetical protein [Dickeya zeae]|uniref:hypothetical protein n=1 Tax=Dickeya zeae TaxID=204042 RepID=UPI001CF0E234|nr:hypothetical protein [Dickeya zeae]MCA6985458.1 hypothetical protein [Dickeya zeae]
MHISTGKKASICLPPNKGGADAGAVGECRADFAGGYVYNSDYPTFCLCRLFMALIWIAELIYHASVVPSLM